VERKPYKDRPAPPFTTSTLQQDMNRKLRWTAQRTMSVAQRLYETGWITYMRTDSLNLSNEAISAARRLIEDLYGPDYLPQSPRFYKSNVKNAQEAHEAIRPAGTAFKPLPQAKAELDPDGYRLYELIWMRTVASQMADAEGHNVVIRLDAKGNVFVATGKTIEFPGFRRAYVEGSDDPDAEIQNRERILPALRAGDTIHVTGAEPRPHETQPPPRLTEATLVKELEARGIGRPSTYASIIETILKRTYAFKKGTALVPTFTAMAVTGLLEGHLGWLVDYDFTAKMEEDLDEIALGRGDSTRYLEDFYMGERGLRSQLTEAEETIDARQVCTIPIGTNGTGLSVRVGKFGPFVESGERRADVPEDMPPDELTPERAEALIRDREEGPRKVGIDPATGLEVFVMKGRFGPYVQLGPNPEGKDKPRRASLLKGMEPASVDLGTALRLLSLPRTLGSHPATGEDVMAANGKYGPYVKSGATSRSLPADLSPLDVTLDRAVALLAESPKGRRRRGPEPLREVGVDSSTGRTLKLMSGRFGPYVTDGETNASLKRDMDPEQVDLSMAIELIRAREGAPKRPRRGRAPARKTSEPKPKRAKKPKAD
jgi:DNA topoisomerase-1